MDLDPGLLIGLGGGAVGGGSLAVWAVKSWVNSALEQIKENSLAIRELEKKFERVQGKDEGTEKLFWNELKRLQDDLVVQNKRLDKAWSVLERAAGRRVSDTKL